MSAPDDVHVLPPPAENCANTIAVVPIVGVDVVLIQPVAPFSVPEVTRKKSPPPSSAAVSASVARVST
jgi:hypothetical protein